MTAPCTIAGMPVLTARVPMAEVGVWHADIVASGAKEPSGRQTLTLHGVDFVGTVTRARAVGGRCKLRMVGGAGGLTRVIAAKHWTSPTVSEVVYSILQSCGETLSKTSDSALLARRLDQWKRTEAEASRALQAICDNQGAIWRVLRDGTIWVGFAEYPERTTKHVFIDDDWSAGVIEIAPEKPDLTPGITFRGQQIRYVVHLVTQTSLRSEACLEPPSGLLDRFLAGVRAEIGYARTYPARVVRQNADGTLQVLPDDQKLKGAGLDKVQIRSGVPGFAPRVQKGARVSVEFENGDPSKPRATCWDHDPVTVTSISFCGGSRAFARIGDRVDVFLGVGSTFSITGLINASDAFTGTMTLVSTNACHGVVAGGNPKLTG